VEITNNDPPDPCTSSFTGGGNSRMLAENEPSFVIHPNPNRGDQLFVNMTGLDPTITGVTMDVFDPFGKRVMSGAYAVNDGTWNEVLRLPGGLAAGVYVVHFTAGASTSTQRLIIEP
jgi:hypothetical protein